MPATRKHPPKNETPREKFIRLANARVQKAISAINLVGQLASPRYDYTDRDVDAIVTVLKAELDKASAQLKNHEIVAGETFKLS